MVEKGLAVRWIDPDKIIKPTPMSIIAYQVNTDWAQGQPEVATKLFIALARAGREYCQAYHHGPNRAEVVDVLIKYKAMSDRDLTDRMPWQARDPNGRFNPASVVDVQDWFFKQHIIDKKAPDDRLVDNAYADDGAQGARPVQAHQPRQPARGLPLTRGSNSCQHLKQGSAARRHHP